MNLQIQSVKFDADSKLISHIESKMAKLDRFDDNITSSQIFLKLDNDADSGNKVVTMNVKVKGSELVAEKRSRSFEESFDVCFDAIKSQISKRRI